MNTKDLKIKDLITFIKQFIRFGIVGVMNTLFNYLCYSSLVLLGINYLIANTIAWILGIMLSYLLNTKFVFSVKPEKVAVLKTYIVYGISYGVTMLGIFLLVEQLFISEFIAPIIMLFFSVPFNFLAMKFWAMKKKAPQINKKVSCVVFDLDGTLFATHPGIFSSIQTALTKNGFDKFSSEALNRSIGLPISTTFHRELGVEGDTLSQLTNDYRDHNLEYGIYECSPYPGTQDLLVKLKDKGYKLGVATYKRDDISKKLVSQIGFEQYFDVICGLDNDGKLSKIQILQSVLNSLKAPPEETLMVGDSYYDYDAATKCGCMFIGITHGYGFDEEEISRLKNIIFVDDMQGLARVLKV